MLGAKLREKCNIPLHHIGKLIGKTHINPNLFTILGVVWALFGTYYLATRHYFIGLLFVILATGWDGLDGSVARAQKKTSKFGNYLDALIDKYVEIFLYLGLALGGFSTEAFLIITGSLVLSYAKPRTGIVVPIDNHDWPAIGERVDRIILLIIALIFGMFFPKITILGYTLSTMSILFYLLAIIVYIGSVQRILYAKKIIEAGGTANLNVKKRE